MISIDLLKKELGTGQKDRTSLISLTIDLDKAPRGKTSVYSIFADYDYRLRYSDGNLIDRSDSLEELFARMQYRYRRDLITRCLDE